jgi:hypothetical protein
MEIKNQNGSYLIYTIFQDRIDIDNIKSNLKVDGTKLINQLKNIAFEFSLPLELYSEPQDDTISQEELNYFYKKNGFYLHTDDIDNSYYILN